MSCTPNVNVCKVHSFICLVYVLSFVVSAERYDPEADDDEGDTRVGINVLLILFLFQQTTCLVNMCECTIGSLNVQA